MSCTEISLLEVIERHGGVVASGSHEYRYGEPDCPLCILEAHAACLVERGELDEITDDPAALGRPDYRPINDAAWSSREVATPHLIRLHMAYDGWAEWGDERRLAVVSRITIETVRRIIAELPGMPNCVRQQCRDVSDLKSAAAAAYVADAAMADAAMARADAAADAAANAAANAADAAAWADKAAAAAWAAAWAAAAAAYLADKAAADSVLIHAVDIWVGAAHG